MMKRSKHHVKIVLPEKNLRAVNSSSVNTTKTATVKIARAESTTTEKDGMKSVLRAPTVIKRR
jgi:hypothetical protein